MVAKRCLALIYLNFFCEYSYDFEVLNRIEKKINKELNYVFM